VDDASTQPHSPGFPDGPPPRRAEWDGKPLSIEGEVALIVLGASPTSGDSSPRPVIAAACGGATTCLVRVEQFAAFLSAHHDCKLVCHGAGSLHGMLEAHLRNGGNEEAIRCLWEFSRTGRLLDVTLLDQLLDMAEVGIEKNPCRLAEIAKKRCDRVIPNAREVQSRIDRSRGEQDPTLEQVALSLVHALTAAYHILRLSADEIAAQHKDEDGPNDEVGPLSLGIQVRGGVALDRISRGVGLRVDRVKDLIERCEIVYQESARRLLRDRDSEKCFKRGGGDSILLNQHGQPETYNERLRKWLASSVEEIRGVHGLPFRPPHTSRESVAQSAKFWDELAPYHPGLDAWVRLESSASVLKLLKAAGHQSSCLLRPTYQALPRILSVNPSLESLRRMAPWPIFSAPSGFRLLVGELCDLELRLLANAYPSSPEALPTMAMVFEHGQDPRR
jgi:hypothetical protein